MRITLLFFTLLLSTASLLAQEYLKPLSHDRLKQLDTEQRLTRVHAARSNSSMAVLPFIDDFSQDHFPGNTDGNTVLWQDLNVSRYRDFGIDVPSIGVAVFDGLTAHGAPYETNGSTADGRADTLTSEPIDLSATVNVVLSFFYQSKGVGEAPEGNDSLMVQFFDPTLDSWSTIWSKTGTPLTEFIPVLLPVEEPFLQAGFQFRYINYGRLTGALDQWAVDWVYMDANRAPNDSTINDVGFYQYVNSILNEQYTALPWPHFLNSNVNSRMLTQVDVLLRNNRELGALISESGYDISYEETQIDAFTDEQSPSIEAGTIEAITQEIVTDPNFFAYPLDVSDTSACFDVEFYFETQPDLNPDNNRMGFTQQFKDYYAYDDGQADNAYGIINFNAAGKVAMAFDLIQADTIIAIDMNFLYQAPAAVELEDQLFFITIWEALGDSPGEIVYQDSQPRSVTFDENGGFVRFHLEDLETQLDASRYFFGWVQPNDISTNIGNDRSVDLNVERLYFDVGFGWTESSYPGTIMIRPVFPSLITFPSPVSNPEYAVIDFELSPNPAQHQILLKGAFNSSDKLHIIDSRGRLIINQTLSLNAFTLDVSSLSNGVYMLGIVRQDGSQNFKRLVIKH